MLKREGDLDKGKGQYKNKKDVLCWLRHIEIMIKQTFNAHVAHMT